MSEPTWPFGMMRDRNSSESGSVAIWKLVTGIRLRLRRGQSLFVYALVQIKTCFAVTFPDGVAIFHLSAPRSMRVAGDSL